MGTIIYQTPYADDDSHYWAVGQIAESGIVYTTPYEETPGTAVGQVSNGVVYDHPYLQSRGSAVGHINGDGVVYSTPVTEGRMDAVGHVSRAGVVYSDPFGERNADIIGHVKGPDRFGAAAAFLLLLYNPAIAREQRAAYRPPATDFMDTVLDLLTRRDDSKKPCEGCGKMIPSREYAENRGVCAWCGSKEQVWKDNLAERRRNYLTCPHCRGSIEVGTCRSIRYTFRCPYENCRKTITIDTTNGRILRK